MSAFDIQHAIDLLEQGRTDEAIPLLQHMVDAMPMYVAAHVLLARAYEAEQQWRNAQDAWQRAHFFMPNSPSVRDGIRRANGRMATAWLPPSGEQPPAGSEVPEPEVPEPEAWSPLIEGAPEAASLEAEPLEPEAEAPRGGLDTYDAYADDDLEAAWSEPDEREEETEAFREAPPAWEDVEMPAEDEDAWPAAPTTRWQEPAPDAYDGDEPEAGTGADVEAGHEPPELPPEEETFVDLTEAPEAPPLPPLRTEVPPNAEPEAAPTPEEEGASPPPGHAGAAVSWRETDEEHEAGDGEEAPAEEKTSPPEFRRKTPDFSDLDRLIGELESARIVPRPDLDSVPPPELEDEIEDMVSETLARIYASQHQFDEAARVYELLSGQQPERADEFLRKAAEMRARAADR